MISPGSSKIPLPSLLLALLVPLLPAPSAAEAPVERSEVITLTEECRECHVRFSTEWRYHPGDDPSWADPNLDDSGWALVEPSLAADEIPGGWPGIGWFRRRVLMVPELGDITLGLHITQAGASEVYVDGHLEARFGTVSISPAEERPLNPQYVASLHLEPGVEHVVAVRYSNVTGNVFGHGFKGFELTVGELQHLTAYGLRRMQRYTAVMAMAIGLFGAFVLLHGLLLVLRPRALENLYFVLFSGSMVAMLVCEVQMNSISELSHALVMFKGLVTFSVTMALSAVLLERSVFHQRVGVTLYLFLAAAGGLLLWVWTRPAFFDLLPFVVFVGLVYLEALGLAVAALLRREPEAWVIGAGFLVLTLVFLLTVLRLLGLLELPESVYDVLGLVALAALSLSFSIYLTRRVARTHRELAARLVEVESLTARTIEQERRAAREEAERRVLEADNQRKTHELEEARRLQLAMLPRELPELANYEFAVHMTTANEVGGDYYDFRTDEDGGCLLAVGDATGHGLHAGMMVAVAKSLFQTSCGETSLTDVLLRIGAGLSTLNRREASMALVLVHLNGQRLRIASAGMPPLLLWRRATGAVEEVMLPGVPLGTLAGASFSEHQVVLGRGDAALLMSDGFAEVTDPAGEPLGYERAERIFADAATLPPQAMIDRMVERVREFHAAAPLPDDMTLVALRARL